MTNLERVTRLENMAAIMTYVDDLADKACNYNVALHGGKCPFGEEGPEDTEECIKCNRAWLQPEEDS